MKWSKIRLIVTREIRDQLRDRRTLFTIAVLPLLLYPLLGMSFLQVAQFMHERPMQIWFVGSSDLPPTPALLVDGKFSTEFCAPRESALLELTVDVAQPAAGDPDAFLAEAAARIHAGRCAAVVRVPPGFAASLEREASASGDGAPQATPLKTVPQLEIITDASDDSSQIAQNRIQGILAAWRESIVNRQLRQRDISPTIVAPFKLQPVDISQEFGRRAAIWAKILPFVVLIWALTGAFYPAVDLCAGEKERGTLETLLTSPAERSEIVWGKLLTIMLFSMATALLNLLSIGITGAVVVYLQPMLLPFGPPPLSSVGWLLLALVPVCALFGALALAIAAFARSTKEGQYYLMPLLVISLPLMILPLMPSAELNFGTSLIPITGIILLLKDLIEGHYREAATFALPVTCVTLGAGLLAIRWAIDQFNKESVLFRESEQWSLRLWWRQVARNRAATPTVAQAVACGLLLLLIRFFASFAATETVSWTDFARVQLVTLVGLVALPAVIMTLLLTRNPQRSLLLMPPPRYAAALAGLLALSLHPLALLLAETVQRIYPIVNDMHQQLEGVKGVFEQAPSIWHILALMALVPAICEELAFRGFILSGLRHLGHKWAAIVISSVFFGLTHGILQQSISAAIVGTVIGYVAVQTGSLLPAMVFHLVYNSLSLLVGLRVVTTFAEYPWLGWLFTYDGQRIAYHWPLTMAGTLAALALLAWLHYRPYDRSPEEALQQALDHQTARTATQP